MFKINTNYDVPPIEAAQGTVRALFIESADDQNKQIATDLALLDIEVRWAQTFKEGLEKIEQDNVDVVLINSSLPDSNGLTAVQANPQTQSRLACNCHYK